MSFPISTPYFLDYKGWLGEKPCLILDTDSEHIVDSLRENLAPAKQVLANTVTGSLKGILFYQASYSRLVGNMGR